MTFCPGAFSLLADTHLLVLDTASAINRNTFTDAQRSSLVTPLLALRLVLLADDQR